MRNLILKFWGLFILLGIVSCQNTESQQEEQSLEVSVKTTHIEKADISSNVRFNGKTIYLNKNQIITPISGFVRKVAVKYGDFVKKNDLLFEIETKENKALSKSNSEFSNLGVVRVLASADGFISELLINQPDVYVMEGNLLGTLIENGDLRVQVDIPYEYNALMRIGISAKLFFADGSNLSARVSKILPQVNSASQTQLLWLKPESNRPLPENLNVIAQFSNEKHLMSSLVSRSAIMTNEMQSEFWVMKITNQNLAIKIPIIKGLENDSLVEILSPEFSMNDLIITEGAYELADSTVVKILN